jgi:hypothetical protein
LEGNCRENYFWEPSQIDAKSPISFVIPVRPSVCMSTRMYHLSSHWMDFCYIYI